MFWLKFRDRSVNVKIILLDTVELDENFKGSARGRQLLDFVLDHLCLLEREYFGLRYLDADDQVHWLDTNKSLRKQLKKCTTPYVFYFCVKYYHPEPEQLQEERTRYQFFLQLKRDILHQLLSAPFEALAELGAYALQSDFGPFDPTKDEPGYASEFTRSNFAPDPTGRLVKAIETKHQTLRGQLPADAERHFLNRARRLDLYGVDMHPVLSDASGDAGSFLGLSPAGVMLIQNDLIMGEYAWSIIARIDKDVDSVWPTASRTRGGTIMIHLRAKDCSIHSFGFRLATKEACKHFWKTALEHDEFHRKLRGDEIIRTPSLSSRIFRLGSRFRSSSRAESDTTSVCTSSEPRRGGHRFEPKFERPPSIRVGKNPRQRLQSTVIYEDESRSVIRSEYNTVTRRQFSLTSAECAAGDEITELRSAPVIGKARGGAPSRRSVSPPMSLQSSFSTCPRRMRATFRGTVDQDHDNDSVFSDSSRMSHMTGDDTFGRKRKRSTLGENHSSGTSEDAEHFGNGGQRVNTLRVSLGPQRRRGKMPVRHKTHDGIAIQQAMAQLNAHSATLGRELSLPERLAAVMQPAKSMTMICSTRPAPLSIHHHLGKSMNQLNTGALSSPLSTKDIQGGMGVHPHLPIKPSETLYLNSNTLNPPITPSAKLKGFEFKFGNPPPPMATLERREIPTSSSWTAGEKSDHSKQIAQSPSAGKEKSFDFRIDASRSARPIEEPPRHVRSLSSSSPTASLSNRRLPTRSRLRSDSCFQPSTSREQQFDDMDHYSMKTEVDHYVKENSPLLSPFPIIPPPTPFTEDRLSSPLPPAVPARNSTCSTSKLGARRGGLTNQPSRNESFNTAVKSADIEMQMMRPVTIPDENSPLYHIGDSGMRVVSADIHMPNGHQPSDRIYDAVPPARPKAAVLKSSSSLPLTSQPLQNSAVQNQMYFDMNNPDIGNDQTNPSNRMQTSHKNGQYVQPVPLRLAQRSVPPTSHPLGHSTKSMVYSAKITGGMEGYTQNEVSAHLPSDENDPNMARWESSPTNKLQSIYSTNGKCPMSTDI